MKTAQLTGPGALRSVRLVKAKGKRLVVIDADEWEALIEWLETIEDMQIVRKAYDQLKKANGNRRRAGWRKWTEVRDEL